VWSNSSSDRYHNNAYNYLSAAGGFLQSIINGYGGIRLRSDRLEINPELPPGVSRMHFVGIDYRGSHLDVVVSRFEVMVMVTSVDQNSAPLKLFSFNPEETHSLNPNVEVRIGRKPVAISAAAFLPSSSPPIVAEEGENVTR
jgi:trehalose/maltose hydrolase-like predicted phosphorylase